jgi:hypothetical protein
MDVGHLEPTDGIGFGPGGEGPRESEAQDHGLALTDVPGDALHDVTSRGEMIVAIQPDVRHSGVDVHSRVPKGDADLRFARATAREVSQAGRVLRTKASERCFSLAGMYGPGLPADARQVVTEDPVQRVLALPLKDVPESGGGQRASRSESGTKDDAVLDVRLDGT